jgi:hypothetical protein
LSGAGRQVAEQKLLVEIRVADLEAARLAAVGLEAESAVELAGDW